MPSKPKPRRWRVTRRSVEYYEVEALSKEDAIMQVVNNHSDLQLAGHSLFHSAEPVEAVSKRKRAKLGIS